MRRLARTPARGFTLLEIMVALAILSMTLVVLLEIVTNNVRATNHAKLTTAATFLARSKMIDVEDIILDNGFSTTDENANGTFKDQGFANFSWDYAIERVELPTDMTKKAQDQAQDKTMNSKDPMSMMTGFLGGMMSSFIEPIRLGLQESVRRVTVHVYWDETGRPNQGIEVVQYLTDPAKLQMNLTGGPAGPGAGAGSPAMPNIPGFMGTGKPAGVP